MWAYSYCYCTPTNTDDYRQTIYLSYPRHSDRNYIIYGTCT